MTDYVLKMLEAAAKAGLHIEVDGGGEEPDYSGFDAAKANEAVNAVDEAHISLTSANTALVGAAFIVNGLEEDERIADCDCNGFVRLWIDEHIPGASADG